MLINLKHKLSNQLCWIDMHKGNTILTFISQGTDCSFTSCYTCILLAMMCFFPGDSNPCALSFFVEQESAPVVALRGWREDSNVPTPSIYPQ